ncbi:MAG: SelB domain-containing protein [Nocardioidaceae bacterium]
MHVVATAGHVDHGKSTLVRALTGTDPDRLEEEHRRGLSIELGYVWTDLPPAGEVAFVDVPGHERFVSTMLAGVGPVPAVLFVVAADDPWMPQAAEHLAALDALGVRHGVLAVTRSDLADPGPVRARALEQIARTSLGAVPAVEVSGRTGAGLDRLRATLAGLVAALPAPDPAADVRLWVDRVFHVRGAGTGVTGTLPAGTVAVGDTLALGDTPLRVRGLESLGRPRSAVSGVARVALNLGGRVPGSLARGSVLVTPAAWQPTTVVDVALAGPGPLPERPQLHVGAAATAVRVRPLDESHLRLTLPAPLPLRVGDRALLRDPGSRAVWGITVLDPAPPPLRRRGAAGQRAKELAAADGSVSSEVARRGAVRTAELRRIGVPASPVPDDVVAVGEWLVSAPLAAAARARLPGVVAARATALEPGVPVAAVARDLDLPTPELVPLLVAAPVTLSGGRVFAAAPAGLPPRLLAALAALQEDLAAAPFAAPTADRLRDLGLDAKAVAALARAGHLLRLDAGIVLLPGADAAAVDVLRGLPQPFTTSEARAALGTSRRVVLPLLARLDRTGLTTRLPDDRRHT